MCNCGKKRAQLKPQSNIFNNSFIQQPVYEQQVQSSPAQTKQTVMFQYTGNTALTVTGSLTRKSYRFNFRGDIQAVAINDAAGMAAVPMLKRI